MEKVLCMLALLAASTNASIIDRISGGSNAADQQFPYVASIQRVAALPNQSAAHWCGGTLITLQHVLSAARCTIVPTEDNTGNSAPMDASQYRVYAGNRQLTGDNVADRVRSIANYTAHPEFLVFPSLLNDIAVFTLYAPFLATTVTTLPLPTSTGQLADFTQCTLAGWGRTSPTATTANIDLKFVTKYIYNQDLCTALYSELPNIPNVHPSMICAASYDVVSVGCAGDEGSALVCEGELAGILSLSNECQATSFPELYTRVSNYTEWVSSITAGASTFKPHFVLFAVVAVLCMTLFS